MLMFWKRFAKVLFVGLVLFSTLHAQTVQQRIDQGWSNLQKGNASDAEKNFSSAVNDDASSERAAIALSFLYSWQHRYSEAWAAYEKAMKASANPDALLYASLASVMVQSNSGAIDNKLVPYYTKLVDKPDSMGILSAMSRSRLGDFVRLKKDFTKSDSYYASLNTVEKWQVIGPFENISGSGYDFVYEPERNIDMNASYAARFGSSAKWFEPRNLRPDRWFDIERHFVTTDGVFYALSFVYSPQKQKVHVRMGTSGAFKVFLNDELALSCEDEYNNDLDTYICETELQSGWNKVLVKMCVWDISRNNFMLRIVDPSGNAVKGIEYSTKVNPYTAKPGASFRRVANPFEAYILQMVERYPESIEYRILLADCYLRNDRGEDGEIALRDALKRKPDCVVILDRMMEAYQRNTKRDLVVSTLEKIWSIDSTDISALEFKFNEAIRNKSYDEAERLLSVLVKVCPQEDRIIAHRISLLANQEKQSEVVDLIKSSYEKLPHNYGIAIGMATLYAQEKHDYAAARGVLQDFLSDQYSLDALNTLSEVYLQSNDLSGWERTRESMARVSNNAPGFLYKEATLYFRLEKYDEATEKVKSALECCPGAGDYYELLGDIVTKKNGEAEGLKLYKQALSCYPGYLKLREKIRGIENKKPVAALFSKFSIDSLIKTSPSVKDMPDDESVIVLDDAKTIVYPEGSDEEQYELLVKILKQEGIDQWKELNVGSNSTIEKAVSIKANGTEIRADINRGEMVFKSLQEGDFIYVRYRNYSRSPDRFFKQFSDRRFFNGRYPTVVCRLALITPKDYRIQYRCVNDTLTPRISSCDDGTMYEWRLDHQAPIRSEASMPGPDVTSKYVEISSVPSWQYIANWYCDVTNRKAKATYEIREKMQELAPSAEKLSDDEITRRVYQFITDSVRYSYVPFRQSGGTPQRARDVFITRIGDCKDVATLGISMLSCAGIKADYVLVKTNSAMMPDELPSQEFDHVIARVHLKSGMKYLDFTASNFPVGSLPSGDIDAFSLLIQRDVTKAQRIERKGLLPNTYDVKTQASVTLEGDLRVQRQTRARAGIGASYRYAFKSKGRKENEKSIVEDLSRSYPNVQLKSMKFDGLDSLSEFVNLSMEFEAPKYLSEAGAFHILKMPWLRKLNLEEEFSYTNREYPIEIGRFADSTREEINLSIPEELEPLELPKELRKSSALGEYSLKYSFNNHILKAERIFSYKVNSVSVADYVATREFVNSITKEDTRQILLGPAKPAAKPRKGGAK